MLFISDIELPKKADAEAFGNFMQDEYIPAVFMGQTRVGRVEHAELLQGSTAETDHRFLWLVRWIGMSAETAGASIGDEAVNSKFEEFGARMKPQIRWQEVAARSSSD